MTYQLYKGIEDDRRLHDAFNDLARQTFNISFADWYTSGYWGDGYIPYLLTDGEKAVANVSVNLISAVWDGQPRTFVQIGTVMTGEAYRRRGLSRYLLGEVLKDWRNRCDAIYLFANNTVLDFYPRFGFERCVEYQCSMPIAPLPIQTDLRQLDMDKASDRKLLEDYYAKGNPFARLSVVDNYGLLMFYCSNFKKDCVYYSQAHNAILILERKEANLLCYDVFCDNSTSLDDILESVVGAEVATLTLGFTPNDTSRFTVKPFKGDDTLFVLSDEANYFGGHQLMFPLLSHA